MPKINHRLDSAFFIYKNPQISATFYSEFMPNLNGGLSSANGGMNVA